MIRVLTVCATPKILTTPRAAVTSLQRLPLVTEGQVPTGSNNAINQMFQLLHHDSNPYLHVLCTGDDNWNRKMNFEWGSFFSVTTINAIYIWKVQ
jgi:hypothetical protein